jgi:hypothetical protein
LPEDHPRVACVDPLVGVKLKRLPALRHESQDLVGHGLETVVGAAIGQSFELGLNPLDLGMEGAEDRLDVAALKCGLHALDHL